MDDPRLKVSEHGYLEAASKPTPEALKDYYANKYYQSDRPIGTRVYDERERDYLRLKIAQKADLVARVRGTSAPGRMLDIGCGEGFAIQWFAERGWDARGIDFSSAGLASYHPHLMEKVEIGDVFDILEQKLRSGERHDLIWLSNVLEHVIDPVGLLRSLHELVEEGGAVMIHVPNDGTRYQENLFENGNIDRRFWIALPDHLSYFDHHGIQSIAGATGWTCREVVADFPIDIFLLHEGSNYVHDRAKGPAAHQARIQMELMLGELPHETIHDLYRAMARAGLGRQLTAILTRNDPAAGGR